MLDRSTGYLVTAKSGRPLSSFETQEAAQAFRIERARRKIPTRLFRTTTIRKELP